MRPTPVVLALLLFPCLAAAQPLTPPPPPPRQVEGLPAPPSTATPTPTPTPTSTATTTTTPTPTATSTSTSTSTATPTAAVAAAAAAAAPASGEDELPLLGLMLDAGFPGGFGASLLVRPIWFSRFHAGLSHNLLGLGVRTGATLVPFHFPIVPTLTGEYGHAFQSDASGLVGRFANLTDAEKTVLEKVGYDYLSLAVGLETGSQRSFAWFLRLGLARVWTRAHDVNAALQQTSPNLTSSDPKIRVTVPTLSTGLSLYF